jgi:DNA (cytosine-5)-methyltransferase 1
MPRGKESRVHRLIAVDLFAGVGGLSLGFEQAGFDVAAAVEHDPIQSAAHVFNFPQTLMMTEPISNVTGDRIRKASGIGDSTVSCVFGGPPCQGFSLMGRRALDDPRNRLVLDFVRVVRELGALTFVLENVKGLALGSHRVFLREVIE